MDAAHVKQVRIHIDQKVHHSPTPTTGSALYALGGVIDGLELYREVGGNREDRPVPEGAEQVHLHEDEHLHSGPPMRKDVTIVVDATPHEVPKGSITYAHVVTLSVPDYPQHPEITYSVTYKKGPHENHEGVLAPGGSVKVKEGMAFRVSRTGQS